MEEIERRRQSCEPSTCERRGRRSGSGGEGAEAGGSSGRSIARKLSQVEKNTSKVLELQTASSEGDAAFLFPRLNLPPPRPAPCTVHAPASCTLQPAPCTPLNQAPWFRIRIRLTHHHFSLFLNLHFTQKCQNLPKCHKVCLQMC